MDKKQSSTELADERTDLAEDRTEWAEDRTIMANERTFAGWMRTGLAAVGIGLGFNALFGKLEPFWVPKAIATLFMIIGIFIFWVAQRNGCAVQDRLNSHHATPVKPNNMRVVSGLMASGAIALVIAIWTLNFGR